MGCGCFVFCLGLAVIILAIGVTCGTVAPPW